MHYRVLFVCLGNICRSPAAEGLFRALVERQGLGERFTIDSAGTYHGTAGRPPDPRMQRAAQRRGYTLVGQARPVTGDDFARFDLLVAMDGQNLDDLQQIAGLTGQSMSRIRLLGSFLPGFGEDNAPPVPDPYRGGEEGFEHVLDLIEQACPAMLDYVLTRVCQEPRTL
jgi:protein-tyrosine phosphatase